jgi:hypothetical protein
MNLEPILAPTSSTPAKTSLTSSWMASCHCLSTPSSIRLILAQTKKTNSNMKVFSKTSLNRMGLQLRITGKDMETTGIKQLADLKGLIYRKQ